MTTIKLSKNSKSTLDNPKSQKEKILAHLKTGRNLTSLSALGMYGVYRLASRINDLRNEGYNIKTIRCKDATGKSFAMYRYLEVKTNPGIMGIF